MALFFTINTGFAALKPIPNDEHCFAELTHTNQCLQLQAIQNSQQNIFTQGIAIQGTALYQSSGLYGHSFVQKYNLTTHQVSARWQLPKAYFAEGLSWHKGKIFVLSWREQTAWMLNSDTLQVEKKLRYTGEGWGLTSNGSLLILSNGSATLAFKEPNSMNDVRSIQVHEVNAQGRKKMQPNINELEWINQRIWANIWQSNTIVIINPGTGEIESKIDLSPLLSKEKKMNATAGVLNGIAYAKDRDVIYLSGKNWQHIYTFSLREKNTH